MKIQHYITLLVLATVITLIGAAEWSQSKKSKVEKREAFYSNLSAQAANFENTINDRIESLRNQLAQAASRHTDSTSSLTSDSAFSAIAWLQKNPEGSAAKYKAVWAEANTQTFDPSWLKGLNFSQVKDGETLFVRRVDRNGNAFFAMVMTAVAQSSQLSEGLPEQTGDSSDRVYLFAAISPSALSSWVDEWVGSSRGALVFDDHGNVISHSQRQYTGTNLGKDKLVSASMRSGKSKITSDYSDLEGRELIGESVKVAQTNLRAAVTVPRAALLKPSEDESGSSRGLLITLGLFLVAATHFVGGRLARKVAKVEQPQMFRPTVASALAQVEAAPPNSEVVAEVIPEKEITFEEVENKTKLNLEEILARSAEIRQRLQVDFMESVESEQKLFFEELASVQENSVNEPAPKVEENLPKVKVRRPKVSL